MAAVLCGLALCLPASAAPTVLPDWQSLVFERSGFGVTAHSRVELAPAPGRDGAWVLRAESSVASNSELLELVLDPVTGASLERSRLSTGRNQRLKTWEYLDTAVVRLRREPHGDTGVPPEQWPVSSRVEIALPDTARETVVTDPNMLLLLAARLQCSENPDETVVVHTDRNFYRVTLQVKEGPVIELAAPVAGLDSALSGKRRTRQVGLQITALVGNRDKPDFSLFGLEREISLLFDVDTGLPLRLLGRAPRVGMTYIDLREASLRTPPV